VNPVIPEVINQIAFAVIGNDMTVTMAAEGGQLQLNAFEPIIARALMMSITQLAAGCYTLADRCISGITANAEKMHNDVEWSIGLVTALSPTIGYENATLVAQRAAMENTNVRTEVLKLGLMTEAEFDAILGNVDLLAGPQN
jgi:aspartate ammonia-lyase